MADKATIVVHSGDMDKLYSALIIGNGAVLDRYSAGVEVQHAACSTLVVYEETVFNINRWTAVCV